jgi:hypothetical protein
MPNSDRRWLQRAVAAGSIKAIASQITLTYVIPIALPIVTVLAGYLHGLPWMYLLTAAGIMFATISTGLVRFDEWIDRRRVSDKLRFASVRIGKDIRGEGFFLGVVFHNAADVTMEFEIEEMRTRLGNRVPEKISYDQPKIVIPPRGNGWLDDHVIDIGEPLKPGTLEGFIECKVKYGRTGDLRYDLNIKKQVLLSFNDDGLLGPCSWNDAA